MTPDKRTLLVTNALPYANGPLHLGHLLEHIQTDIWVRVHRLLGHDCISVCGEDAHGTPIMLKAEQLGISPETLIADIKQSHEADFQAFDIHYDQYHSTHSPENEAITAQLFQTLQQQGDILVQDIQQAYDPVKNMFLPDRYVKGTCPRCQAPDQYGDNCESCGATYHTTDLLNPVSTLSGVTPIEKISTHYFFNLPHYESFLKAWTRQGALQKEMANKLDEWFTQGLKTWDISRDTPYFGFLIPGTADKYFYVWLDAPVGYMASFQKYAQTHGLDTQAYWGKDSTVELYQFIGKDILYFHALFWPAILHATNHRLPTGLFTHGFLTIDGQKMSKSRGTFIQAQAYRQHLNPQYLRYYFAAKLTSTAEDIDLNFEDFTRRIHADLIGKIVNIASRSCSFIHKYFSGRLATALHDLALYEDVLAAKTAIVEAYVQRDYAHAMRQIMEQAALVNQYIEAHQPWHLIKDPTQHATVHGVCSMSLNLFRLLITYLKPVLPQLARDVETLLAVEPLTFLNMHTPLLDHVIQPFVPLLDRIQPEQIEQLRQDCRMG